MQEQGFSQIEQDYVYGLDQLNQLEISMNDSTTQFHGDDVCLWPDGSHSYWSEMTETERVQGDYERLPADSDRWIEFVNAQG